MYRSLMLAALLFVSPLMAETPAFLMPVQDSMLQELQDFLVDDVFDNPRALEQELLEDIDRTMKAAEAYDTAQRELWQTLDPDSAAELSAAGRKMILTDCRTALAQSLWCGSPEKMEKEAEVQYPDMVEALIGTQASKAQVEINQNMMRASEVMEAYMQSSRSAIGALLASPRNPVTGELWSGNQQQRATRQYEALLSAGADFRKALLNLSAPGKEEFWSTGLPMFVSALTCRLLESEESMLLLLLPSDEN